MACIPESVGYDDRWRLISNSPETRTNVKRESYMDMV